MKLLHRYLIKEFLLHLVFVLLIFLFVMLAGKVMKELLTVLISKHLGWDVLLLFVGLNAPFMLSYSLPLAVLTAAVLTFSKLSADNEMLAARASGVSLWHLAMPVIIAGGFLGVAAFCSNAHLAPRGLAAIPPMVRDAIMDSLQTDSTVLFEPERAVKDFPGYVLQVGDKDPETGRLLNVQLSVLNKDTGTIEASYRAEAAEIAVRQQGKKLHVRLFNLTGAIYEPDLRPGLSAQEYELEFDLDEFLARAGRQVRWTDRTLWQLFEEREGMTDEHEKSAISVEAHSRVAFAFACLAFAMVGVPLGLKTHRRETSIGMLVSILAAVAYYSLVVLAQSLKTKPEFHPVLILWSPNVLAEALGLWLLWRAARR